ncbi:MAG: hypothetical protein CM15mP120_08340 [Pseudomonadota bacterium]|nr:MAG: hypothetical protein CM15mP120_08340 [Pseudomonadota bacterium]
MQSQVAAPPHTGRCRAQLKRDSRYAAIALHDRSREIGRVILTGGDQTGQDSQLTQFMRDHGFSEGGMAGYMKQTMLGAGAAVAKTRMSRPTASSRIGRNTGNDSPGDAALIEPNLAAMALGCGKHTKPTAGHYQRGQFVHTGETRAALSSEAKVLPNAALSYHSHAQRSAGGPSITAG